jgi:hypothetical protein
MLQPSSKQQTFPKSQARAAELEEWMDPFKGKYFFPTPSLRNCPEGKTLPISESWENQFVWKRLSWKTVGSVIRWTCGRV